MEMVLATLPAPGGISAFWLRGSAEELAVLDRRLDSTVSSQLLPPKQLRYGILHDNAGAEIDEVILAAPTSETRILTGHGGTATTLALLELLSQLGFAEVETSCFSIVEVKNTIEEEADARLPECQTETQAAVLLAARSGLAARINRLLGLAPLERRDEIERLLLDYGYAARLLQTQRICLAGAPNVGKSSLMNRLLAEDRVLVNATAGTTRDAVTERIDLGGYAVELIDTAGIRTAAGDIERVAQVRGLDALRGAAVIIFMVDMSRPLGSADHEAATAVQEIIASAENPPRVLLVGNKSDLPTRLSRADASGLLADASWVGISCHAGNATAIVRDAATQLLGGEWSGDACPFTARQEKNLRVLLTVNAGSGESAARLVAEFVSEASPPLTS